MIDVREIKKMEDWNIFINKRKYTLFVQSSDYGDFYDSLGEKFKIFGVYENNKLVGGSLVLSTHAKRGLFLYLPYGPVFINYKQEYLAAFFKYLAGYAKKKGYYFIKCSPFLTDSKENRRKFEECGLRLSPIHVLAENTLILDLNKSEGDLLKGMKKNHRNLIRRCLKEGVNVKISNDEHALADFNELHDATAKRHGFHRFSAEYVTNEFHTYARNNQAAVFRAYLPDGRLDSAAIIIFYGSMAVYRHAASLMLNKKIPTSYALQWAAIKEARTRDMRFYNFWGIAPESAKTKHPFYGITHFKKGFGGMGMDLVPCHDLPLNSNYWLNWGVEFLRKIKRGF